MKTLSRLLLTLLYALALAGAANSPALAQTAAAPTPLPTPVATTCSSTEINLTWAPQASAVTIQRSADGGTTWGTVYTAPSEAAIWTDTSLYPATTYEYRVSVPGSGATLPSSAVSATTQAAAAGSEYLSAPTNVTPTATSPTIVVINFTDTNVGASPDYFVERSDDGGLTYRVVVTTGDNPPPCTDSQLTPGATYYYRVRAVNFAAGASNYTAPVGITMPSLSAGLPNEPTNTAVVNDSATTNTITWTDTNGGAAGYIVERSLYAFTPSGFHFVQVGQTVAGATSLVDTGCAAENSYAYKVEAINADGTSDFDKQTYVSTASAGTGSPKVYDIGPGQTYPTIGSFNWRILGPGDTVNIHGNGTIPYYEMLLLTVRGTAAAPITIQGVPDANGNYPIIDGTNAVQNSQFAYTYSAFGSIGAITTYRAVTASSVFRPGYLIIQNLEIRNCYKGDSGGNTWTDYQGNTQTYGNVGGGIYLLSGDNITIQGCNIHGNGEGVFGAGQSGFELYMGNLVLRGNYIWGNGNVGSDTEHNTYIEAMGVLYEYNHYGPERAGAGGSALKDRSTGTVIRYNYVEATARILDLVEPENEADEAATNPATHFAYVYGNLLAQDDPRCVHGVHYGGDEQEPALYRKGILYFWNNTEYSTLTVSQAYDSYLFDLSTQGESVDARNNIFYFAVPGGGATPELDLLPANGIGYFGVNWANTGWHTAFSAVQFTGEAAGTSNIVSGANPGFVNYAGGDFGLTSTSPCKGLSGPLPANLSQFPLSMEYSQ